MSRKRRGKISKLGFWNRRSELIVQSPNNKRQFKRRKARVASHFKANHFCRPGPLPCARCSSGESKTASPRRPPLFHSEWRQGWGEEAPELTQNNDRPSNVSRNLSFLRAFSTKFAFKPSQKNSSNYFDPGTADVPPPLLRFTQYMNEKVRKTSLRTASCYDLPDFPFPFGLVPTPNPLVPQEHCRPGNLPDASPINTRA